MSGEQVASVRVPSFQNARRMFERETISHSKNDKRPNEKEGTHCVKEYGNTDERAGKKENTPCVNTCEKKVSSQNRLKGSAESKVSLDKADNKANVEEKYIEDVPLEEKLSSDLHDEEPSQGVPLSIKNFFKVVRTATFSKRVPKSPKLRLEPKRNTNDTDVVIFERPTTPQEISPPAGVSRSLPPILDFHDLVGSDGSDDEWEKELETPEIFIRSKTEGNSATMRSIRSLERPSFPELRSGIGRHQLSGMSADLASDGLQQFGSFDEFSTVRRVRETRKSLYKQLEDLDALHF